MKIVLGTFKDNADELAEFLAPKVGTKPSVSGGELDFDDDDVKKTVKPRHVKTYVKRFLNRKGERSNYQILVEGKELRMIELEGREEEKEGEEDKGKKARKQQGETSPPEEEGGEAKETDEGAETNESAPSSGAKQPE